MNDLGASYDLNKSKCPFCQKTYNLSTPEEQMIFKTHVLDCQKKMSQNKKKKKKKVKNVQNVIKYFII